MEPGDLPSEGLERNPPRGCRRDPLRSVMRDAGVHLARPSPRSGALDAGGVFDRLAPDPTTASGTGLASETVYDFSVRTRDAAGNRGQVAAKQPTSFATEVFAGRTCRSPGGEGSTAAPTMNFFNASCARTPRATLAPGFLHTQDISKVNFVTPWGGGAMGTSGTLSRAEVDPMAAWIEEGSLSNSGAKDAAQAAPGNGNHANNP